MGRLVRRRSRAGVVLLTGVKRDATVSYPEPSGYVFLPFYLIIEEVVYTT